MTLEGSLPAVITGGYSAPGSAPLVLTLGFGLGGTPPHVGDVLPAVFVAVFESQGFLFTPYRNN